MTVRPPVSLRVSPRHVAAIFLLLSPSALMAQATLSGQGYGFPTGQFSARTQGTAGGIAEIDPLTPVNPATIAVFPSRILFFQLEPEFRSVKTPNGTERTTTARYPVVFGAMPIGKGIIMSLSSSTLLDRTSTTSFRNTQVIGGGDTVPMTTTYHIDGAMNDVRLAAAWSPKPWLRIGAGAHAITGHNLVNLTQSFDDTVRFSSFAQQVTLGFSGGAVSGGLQLVSSVLSLSASGRWGGSLRVSNEDTVLARANVPNRFGASLSYLGIANSAISIRTSREEWSSMGTLGTPSLRSVDAWDSSIGADLAGPRVSNRIIFLRAGARTRTLPFQAAGNTVRENSFSGGAGTTFANGRVMGDLAIIRALRSADLGASERAWTISLGISVRP